MVLTKVGVTGVSGMLGRYVVAAFKQQGISVVTTSHNSPKKSNIIKWNLEEWLVDSELESIFSGVQAIVHIGAMVPKANEDINEERMFNVNVRSCLNIGLWASNNNIPVVFISGAIVYKEQSLLNQTEAGVLGWNDLGKFYGFSKLLAENVFKSLRAKGLKLAIIRPSSIYGAGLPEGKMISSFLGVARKGGVIELRQPIEDKIDLINASDVANIILKIIQAEEWDVFNVASGKPLSIKELAEKCVLVLGKGQVNIINDHSVKNEPTIRFSLNCKHAKSRLNWEPSVSIEDGLSLIF